MKKTLKMLSILLTLALVLAVSGCENGSGSDGSTAGGNTPENGSNTSATLAAPTGLKTEESKSEHNKLTISWDKVEGATAYEVYQNTSNNFTTAKKISVYSLTSTSYNVTLSSAGTYYFWIKAIGTDDKSDTIESPASTSISYTFTSSELAAPKYVTVSQGTTLNTVSISWQKNGASRYYLYYNNKNDSTTATAIKGDYGLDYVSSYNIPYTFSLGSTGTYYFWVVAGDYSGNKSGYSQSTSYEFTLEEVTSPTNVTVVQNSGKNSVRVSWDKNNAAKHKIYYNTTTSNSSYGTEIETVTAATDSNTNKKYADIPISSTGTYYFWVKAVDGNDTESEFSQMVSANFIQQVVPVPTKVTVQKSATDASGVTVYWTPSENASSYYVYYSNTDSTSAATKRYIYGSTDYDTNQKYGEISLTSPSGTYYFWVKAVDEAGIESDYSSPAATITF